MEFAELERLIFAFLGGYESGGGSAPAEIEDAERVLGIRVVGSYRKFLSRFGWIGIGPTEIFGLGRDVPSYLDLVKMTLSERSEMSPPLTHRLLPFFNDGFGNLYCLDTSSSPEGENAVVFWNHELDARQTPEFVSRSFAEWLAGELAS